MKFKPISIGVSIREIDNGFLVVINGRECFIEEEMFCSNLIDAGNEIKNKCFEVQEKWEKIKEEREKRDKIFDEAEKEKQ